MSAPSLQCLLVFEHRRTIRQEIYNFFEANVGKKFSSKYLHGQFGSAFRSRVSDINTDKASQIVIKNECVFDAKADKEISSYWAEAK